MNAETFKSEFGSLLSSKIDIRAIATRKQAWAVYYDIMLEVPTLRQQMPEKEEVFTTMQTVFTHIDWFN